MEKERKYNKLHLLRSICSNLQKRIPQNRNLELSKFRFHLSSLSILLYLSFLPTDIQAALFPSSTLKQLFHDKEHNPTTTIKHLLSDMTETEFSVFLAWKQTCFSWNFHWIQEMKEGKVKKYVPPISSSTPLLLEQIRLFHVHLDWWIPLPQLCR